MTFCTHCPLFAEEAVNIAASAEKCRTDVSSWQVLILSLSAVPSLP